MDYFSGVPVATRPRRNGQLPVWASAIRQRRLQLGMTQEQVEDATRGLLAQRTVSDIELGKTHPFNLGLERFFALLKALHWSPEDFAEATGLEVPIVYRPSGEPREDVVWMPVVAAGTAGRPWPQEGVLPVPREIVRPGSILIRVDGDSMDSGEEDALKDGDLVLVDGNLRDLREGKVYALEIVGDGIAIKRARKTRRGWIFVSDNPAGPILEPDEVRVLGEVYRRISIREVK